MNYNVKALKLVSIVILFPVDLLWSSMLKADNLKIGSALYKNNELTKKEIDMKTLLKYLFAIIINIAFLFMNCVVYQYIVKNFPEITDKGCIVTALTIIWILGFIVSCGFVFKDERK